MHVFKSDVSGQETKHNAEKNGITVEDKTEMETTLLKPMMLSGHTKDVVSVALSTDGSLALSGSWDKTLRLWDIKKGKWLQILSGHTHYVNSVSLSSDGRLAMSGSQDKTVRLWDLETQQCLKIFTDHTHYVNSVSLSADGSYGLSGSADKSVHFWDLKAMKGLQTLSGHTKAVNSVSLYMNGNLALSGSTDTTLQLWDIKIGKSLQTLSGHTLAVNSVSLSADGNLALSGSNDTTLRLWDLRSGKSLQTLSGHTNTVHSVAFSSDNSFALSGGGDNTLRLWDLRIGKSEVFNYPTRFYEVVPHIHNRQLYALTGLGDGTLDFRHICALPGANSKPSQAKEVKLQSERNTNEMMVNQVLNQPQTRNNELVEANQLNRNMENKGESEVALLKPLTLSGHTDRVRSVSISADGNLGLSGSDDNIVRLWDLNRGVCLLMLNGHAGIMSVSISGDGNLGLSGGGDNAVRLWDLKSGENLQKFEGHTGWANSVSLRTDGSLGLSGSEDKTLRLWDLKSGKCLTTLFGHTGAVNSVVLSVDGSLVLSGSADKTLRLWDLKSGKCLTTLFGHARAVNSVVLSVDGSLALSGSVDKTLRLWDLKKGECIKTFTGHTQPVTRVSLLADGNLGLSGSFDGTVRLWDMKTGNCDLIIRYPTIVWSVAHRTYNHQLYALVGLASGTLEFRHIGAAPSGKDVGLNQVLLQAQQEVKFLTAQLAQLKEKLIEHEKIIQERDKFQKVAENFSQELERIKQEEASRKTLELATQKELAQKEKEYQQEIDKLRQANEQRKEAETKLQIERTSKEKELNQALAQSQKEVLHQTQEIEKLKSQATAYEAAVQERDKYQKIAQNFNVEIENLRKEELARKLQETESQKQLEAEFARLTQEMEVLKKRSENQQKPESMEEQEKLKKETERLKQEIQVLKKTEQSKKEAEEKRLKEQTAKETDLAQKLQDAQAQGARQIEIAEKHKQQAADYHKAVHGQETLLKETEELKKQIILLKQEDQLNKQKLEAVENQKKQDAILEQYKLKLAQVEIQAVHKEELGVLKVKIAALEAQLEIIPKLEAENNRLKADNKELQDRRNSYNQKMNEQLIKNQQPQSPGTINIIQQTNQQTTVEAKASAEAKASVEVNIEIDISIQQEIKQEFDKLYKEREERREKEAEESKQKLDKLEHPKLQEYAKYLQNHLQDALLACRSISSGLVKCSKMSAWDYLAKAVKLIGDSLPFIGAFTGFLSEIISSYGGIKKEEAAQALINNFTSADDSILENLSVLLALKFKETILIEENVAKYAHVHYKKIIQEVMTANIEVLKAIADIKIRKQDADITKLANYISPAPVLLSPPAKDAGGQSPKSNQTSATANNGERIDSVQKFPRNGDQTDPPAKSCCVIT